MHNYEFKFGIHKGKTFEQVYDEGNKRYVDWVLGLVKEKPDDVLVTFKKFAEYVHLKKKQRETV